LCGNSLGLQPISTRDYIEQELNDWAQLGVDGHLEAKNPWLPYHEALSTPMAQIVGAKPSEVVIMNPYCQSSFLISLFLQSYSVKV
jgi:kynureninase